MSEIKNGVLDQYGAEPFEQQQIETAGVEGVNSTLSILVFHFPAISMINRLVFFSFRKNSVCNCQLLHCFAL